MCGIQDVPLKRARRGRAVGSLQPARKRCAIVTPIRKLPDGLPACPPAYRGSQGLGQRDKGTLNQSTRVRTRLGYFRYLRSPIEASRTSVW